MSRKRRKFAPELKVKIAREALREEATLAELVTEYSVHPNQIANWKHQKIGLESGAPFDSTRCALRSEKWYNGSARL